MSAKELFSNGFLADIFVGERSKKLQKLEGARTLRPFVKTGLFGVLFYEKKN